MPRTVSTALLAHLRSPSRTICTNWLIEPRYGDPEGYTSLDRDLTIDGVEYSSVANVAPSAVPGSLGLRDNSMDVETFPGLVEGRITAERLLTGYYDEARYRIFIVNYEGDLEDQVTLSAGRIGKGTLTDNGILFELKTWGDILNQPIGHILGPTCACPRWGRGDCANVNGNNDGPNVADHTIEGTITAVSSRTQFEVEVGSAPAAGWADFGYVRFNDEGAQNYQPDSDTSGHRVKKYTVPSGEPTRRTLRLHNALPFDPVVGETVVIERGCARTVEACRESPNRKSLGGTDDGTGNVINMRWCAPYLPGVRVVNGKVKTS